MRFLMKVLPFIGAMAWRNRSKIQQWYDSRNQEPPTPDDR